MPGALANSGAALPATDFAPLHVNRMITGMWSNSNPLRDAATPLYMEKYQGGRQDRIKDGLNTEISPRLTLTRRKGLSVYNSQLFSKITRFYGWNTFTLTTEVVRVMADCASTVYDATGPNTQTAVWTKSPGAGSTYFLGVGNILYFTNGVDNRQLRNSSPWAANHVYKIGDLAMDGAGNFHEVWGANPVKATQVSSSAYTSNPTAYNNLYVTTVSGNNPFPVGERLTFLGFTTVQSANGLVGPSENAVGAGVMVAALVSPSVGTNATVSDGGYAASIDKTGTSAGAAPAWNATRGGITIDNTVAWVNRGPLSSGWGIVAPTLPPTISQTQRPSPYQSWTGGVCYQYHGTTNDRIQIIDSNNNTQSALNFNYPYLVGSATPAWATAQGATTPDSGGTFNWQNEGTAATWTPGAAYTQDHSMLYTVIGGVEYAFRCSQSGNAGPQAPNWLTAIGSVTTDGSVKWTNIGNPLRWKDVAGRQVWSLNQVLDNNGYIQSIIQNGTTGSAAPNWATTVGAITSEPTSTSWATTRWINIGAFSVPGAFPTQYGYAYKNSVTGDVSNMSPASAFFTVNGGSQVIVQGQGSTDPQVDTIIIYRTQQQGATFVEVDEIPAPPPGQGWTYTDTKTDDQLNLEIQAQVLGEGTPLPVGATCLEYHLGRVWAAVGNVVYGSSGPDAVVAGSSGNAGFNMTFTAQSRITRLWANSIGLVVFTVRDSYIILLDSNSGTLYMQKWIENIPLLNYDAFAVFLTTPYMFTGYQTLVTLDPSAGIVEMSFPIADKLKLFDPATSNVTFHTGPSGEVALYIGNTIQQYYYRMSPTSAPESGIVWHPPGYPATGFSCIQSTETTPGVHSLLFGPGWHSLEASPPLPILMRDPIKNTDNGTAFAAYADIGSIVLALPGQLAGVAWMTLESTIDGTPAKLGVLMNEISGTFEDVPRTRQDPPNLPPSTSVISNRHSLLQSQRPVWCRHLQYSISWPAEDAANELLTVTIFGQTWQEQRSQQ
jgi:hypothetical protein